MSEELQVLKIVTQRLNHAEIDYLISGSIAGNYYTIPRMTRDIDVVIKLRNIDIDEFVNLFQNDFYIDKNMIIEATSRQSMFNLIHNEYVVKVDFITAQQSQFQNVMFSRKKEVLVENVPMWFISPEDLILAKLIWAKDSHSEMQLNDVRNLITTVGDIDFNYIKEWVVQLSVEQLYKEVKP